MKASPTIKPMTVAAVGAVVFAAAFLLGRTPLSLNASRNEQVVVKVVRRTPKAKEASAAAYSPGLPQALPSAEEEAQRRYWVPVTDTQPSLGPADALVTIVNWCDFRSPVCQSADAVMKAIMAKYEGRVRWVFRHLPTGPDAVPAHFVAHAVYHYNKKFWEIRERLMGLPGDRALTEAELRPYAEEFGLDWDAVSESLQRFAGFVGTDMRFADQFGVERPMGFFVNGRRLPRATRDLRQGLTKLIEEELSLATRLVQNGTAKSEVYKELTKDGYWGVLDDPAARRAAAASKEQGGDADGRAAIAAAKERD